MIAFSCGFSRSAALIAASSRSLGLVSPADTCRACASASCITARVSASLEDDHGDRPPRLLLVLVVGRPRFGHHPPEPLALLALGDRGAHGDHVALDLN